MSKFIYPEDGISTVPFEKKSKLSQGTATIVGKDAKGNTITDVIADGKVIASICISAPWIETIKISYDLEN